MIRMVYVFFMVHFFKCIIKDNLLKKRLILISSSLQWEFTGTRKDQIPVNQRWHFHLEICDSVELNDLQDYGLSSVSICMCIFKLKFHEVLTCTHDEKMFLLQGVFTQVPWKTFLKKKKNPHTAVIFLMLTFRKRIHTFQNYMISLLYVLACVF